VQVVVGDARLLLAVVHHATTLTDVDEVWAGVDGANAMLFDPASTGRVA
jgi:hypothetical protein